MLVQQATDNQHPPNTEAPSHQTELFGAVGWLIVSTIAFKIFGFQPIAILCWASIGCATGVLAKKNLSRYPFVQDMSRAILSFEQRLPRIYVVILGICCIVSTMFPIPGAAVATMVGFRIGCLA